MTTVKDLLKHNSDKILEAMRDFLDTLTGAELLLKERIEEIFHNLIEGNIQPTCYLYVGTEPVSFLSVYTKGRQVNIYKDNIEAMYPPGYLSEKIGKRERILRVEIMYIDVIPAPESDIVIMLFATLNEYIVVALKINKG